MSKKNQEKKINKPELLLTSKIKVHFSFKYFNYKNIDEKLINNFQKEFKKTFLKMKEMSNYTILEALNSNLMILEKSRKTSEIAKKIIKNDDFFNNSCNSNIYDLFRGNRALRVFGVVDSKQNCFHILMFDPIHDSR